MTCSVYADEECPEGWTSESCNTTKPACPPGFSGTDCEVCKAGVYGTDCSNGGCLMGETCFGRCDGETGECLEIVEDECPEGWSGEECDGSGSGSEDLGSMSGRGIGSASGSGSEGSGRMSLEHCPFPDAVTTDSGTVFSISSLSLMEDSGLVYVHNAVSPEVLCCLNISEQISFEYVSGNSAHLFASSPVLSSGGAIIARLSPDMFGDSIWELKLHSLLCPALPTFDNLLSISISPVNDVPHFDLSPSVHFQVPSAMSYAGRISNVAFNISAGAVNEISQPVTFQVKLDTMHHIFASLPSIDSEGTLSFTLQQNFMSSSSFEFNISVSLSDGSNINNVSARKYMTLVIESCGNQRVSQSEACDDGNTQHGDGCSGTCSVECGFVCSGEGAESCIAVCGDGMVAGGEECDDGNSDAGDGCSSFCVVESGYVCSRMDCHQIQRTPDVCVCDAGFALNGNESSACRSCDVFQTP